MQISTSEHEHLPPLIVAIDGPAGSGKSTTARLAAERLGYVYLDTGAMYRAVALSQMRSEAGVQKPEGNLPEYQIDVQFEQGEMRVLLNGADVSEAIRTPEVGAMASKISKIAEIRERLVYLQRKTAREFVEHGIGVVLDGRDIGTVVFPDADLKIFMVADPEVRARRRQAELAARGRFVGIEDVLAEIRERDRQDSEREIAPLRKADDAEVLDTSRCDVGEQVSYIVRKVRERASLDTVKPSSSRLHRAGGHDNV